MQNATTAKPETVTAEKLAYTINSFAERAEMGRTTIYAEIRAGRLQAKKRGGRTIITVDAARAYLAGLPDMKAAAT